VRRVTILTTLVLAALPLAAAEFDFPSGKWWENERMAERIGLTEEQRSEIDGLVYAHALRMVDLGAAVKRSELEMANEVRRPEFEPERVRKAFAEFQSARQALERERFEMLLAVREVLTTEQWLAIQELQKEMRRRRELGQDRRGPRPPGPGERAVPPQGGPGGPFP
jgi:Spy/CpxP family protein refolding chaperone